MSPLHLPSAIEHVLKSDYVINLGPSHSVRKEAESYFREAFSFFGNIIVSHLFTEGKKDVFSAYSLPALDVIEIPEDKRPIGVSGKDLPVIYIIK